MESFGHRLADLRHRSNLRQSDVASACSVTVQAVSKWERGLSCPDILILDDLAKVLQVPIQDIFDTSSIKNQ
jgi:transcriptional regulator with XRE-family HTH domain